jgi:light-regulated signal transduction histidine kinase (bacteriophytochrome)
MTTVNCNEVIELVRSDKSTIFAETGETFEVEKLPEIKAYATELQVLFQNLISNALKFRKKNQAPHIKISAKQERGGWTFAVQDNGIGIKDIHHEKIFTIYQRLHNRNEYEGTGIGLAHCQKIVELHNGSIWVESKPDEGSTFYFHIPNHE